MNELNRIVGKRAEMVVGATKFTIPTGFSAYAMVVRVDGTIVATLSEMRGNAAAVAVTTKTWEGIALIKGDYVPFEFPVVDITLTGATDSVILYLESNSF